MMDSAPLSPSTEEEKRIGSDPPPWRAEGSGGDKEPQRQPGVGAGGARKKGAWVRAWLLVEQTGQVQLIEVAKHSIMQRTGIPARDLRIIDPALSHPSKILGRERAIVVNLEHIKALITHQEVMFLNCKDPLLGPLTEKLEGIFRDRHAVLSSQESGVELANLEERRKQQTSTSGEWRVPESANGLPFEFVALEACLECATSTLDNEARRMEEEAHTALDKLTTKISTLNLELVRNIKSRLVALTGRVQKVRDELENLLDDDEDMAEMYLTDKFQQQQLESSPSPHSSESSDEETPNPDIDSRKTSGRKGNAYSSSYTLRSASSKHLNVEGLEMILEAYFVQIEGTVHRLSNLREYVDDTEDYINIMLDDKQNNLLQMGVLLSTGTMVASAFVALTGVFGMNIHIDLFDSGMRQFLSTVAGGAVGSFVLFVGAVAWYKHRRFLQ